MLAEWPLVLFTTLGQAGAGLAVFAALHGFMAAQDDTLSLKPGFIFILSALLMAAGFGFATLHLGSPDRIFNAMAQLGSSPLSQEGLVGMLALGAAFAAGVSGLKGRVVTPLAGISLVLALAFVFTMGRIYAAMTTVPTWSNWMTYASFYGSAIFLGGALFSGLGKGSTPAGVAGAGGVVLGGILILVTLPMQVALATRYLADLGSVKDLAAWGLCFTALGLGLSCIGLVKSRLRIPAVLVGLAGVLLARAVFYGIHITLILH